MKTALSIHKLTNQISSKNAYYVPLESIAIQIDMSVQSPLQKMKMHHKVNITVHIQII